MPSYAAEPRIRRMQSSRISPLAPKQYTRQSKLTEEHVEELWNEFRSNQDEKARQDLITHYLPLVRTIAERMHHKFPKHVDVDELIQSGTFGLMNAVNAYDPERGVKFQNYAQQRIRGSILDELRENDWAPRLVRTNSHRIERARNEIESETGTPPTAKEIATNLGITLEEFDRWQADTNRAQLMSLNGATSGSENEGKEITKAGIIEDKSDTARFSELEKSELIDLATRGLSKNEKMIVVMYYLEELTMKEIGVLLSLSESRVCQIHHRIMDRLKGQLERYREDLLG